MVFGSAFPEPTDLARSREFNRRSREELLLTDFAERAKTELLSRKLPSVELRRPPALLTAAAVGRTTRCLSTLFYDPTSHVEDPPGVLWPKLRCRTRVQTRLSLIRFSRNGGGGGRRGLGQ